MPRALTLSVALAVIGLIAAAPASAAQDRKVVKTQVKITRVTSEIVSPDSGPPYAVYEVKGRVRSPRIGCRINRRVELIHHKELEIFRSFDQYRGPGEFPQGFFWIGLVDRTFPFTPKHDRVKVPRSPSHARSRSHPDGRFICEGDKSPRFTIPPPSEAGIAAATEGES